MDRNSKKLLKHLNKCGGCEKFINFGGELDKLSSELNRSPESVRSNVRFLHEHGYIDYQNISKTQKAYSFSLSHKGENWKYFKRQQVLKYIAEKWIDFFALTISLISLAISLYAII